MKTHTGMEVRNPASFMNISLFDVTTIFPERYIVLTLGVSEIDPPI
jgi:hypothetical protein